jgi:hypothetical protein
MDPCFYAEDGKGLESAMRANIRDFRWKVKCPALTRTSFGYNRLMTKDIIGKRISCPDCPGRLRLSFG